MTDPVLCHRCGAVLATGEASFYVVRIEAFADPSPPVESDRPRGPGEGRAAIAELIEAMRDLSEQELLDQVHRRLTLTLCVACYRHWIEHPVG